MLDALMEFYAYIIFRGNHMIEGTMFYKHNFSFIRTFNTVNIAGPQ